ncbi:unnamed protein product [Danaus chrysippus]|uniref:(African queen) hypothetical protein n=1 Tax=Danaus chrysippus TaxID=151541 RepID=A0A8J2VQ90_9NEOP|nr:unnamed protein product [Danaus chrysippus]
MLSVGKFVSLVQQKKQQWAQEREEMSHLYLPWGSGERYTNRLQIRNQFASSLDLHKQSSYEYQEPIHRQRSPSLPPIHNVQVKKLDEAKTKDTINRNVSAAKRFAFYDDDAEGDTSGYGSETINQHNLNQCGTFYDMGNNNPVVAWQQLGNENRKPSSGRSGMTDGALSARSTSGVDEGRPRWGDRGVATGRLWEPTAPTARLPQMPNQKKGTPSWLERGLNMIERASDVIIVDQSSTNSGLDCDRSSLHGSDEGRSFLRGQNVPIEPEIKAQRESKRMKALELQSAILNQLEEREKQRQEERERKIKEERLEELRIQRQQEEDKLRLEAENKRNIEKQLQEQRKLETLKKALEDAEIKARQEKEKRFNYHRKMACLNNSNEKNDPSDKENESLPPEELPSPTKSCSPTKTHRTYNVQSTTSEKKENNSQQTSTFNSPRSLTASNLNLFIHNIAPLSLTENQFNIVPIGITNPADIVNCQTNNIQLAVLVPQNKNICTMSLLNSTHVGDMGEIEKILTPRKYRTLRTRDAYTQTDPYKLCSSTVGKDNDEKERSIDKDYPNIDENAPQESHRISTKKERRLRSEERFKKDIESRPKWGANKPIAQYKKQSEKDPFYIQKRKVRHYSSHSSEDSRSPSPQTRSDKTLPVSLKQRNSLSQSHWKNKRVNQDLSVTAYKVSNKGIPEFTSLSQITGNEKTVTKESSQTNSLKRLTLSQKFINDKYGSRKMSFDDVNDRTTRCSLSDLDNPKRDNDKLFFKTNVSPKDQPDIYKSKIRL